MSTSTTVLALKKAIDTDTARTYLETDLAASLDILDALFNATTGHAHTGVGTNGPVVSGGGGGGGLYTAYLCYQDQKASATNGGTFTSGAWRTRDLNTEVADAGNHGSVASNQITLDAGTYRVLAVCPVIGVDAHKARLQNITDSTTLLYSQSAHSKNSAIVGGEAIITGRFTLAAAKVLEVQHYAQTTEATFGFGIAFGSVTSVTEVYTSIELWKE